MTLNHTTRGYFEVTLINVSKVLKTYSHELSRKGYMLRKPITQAYAVRSDNKLYSCSRDSFKILIMWGFCSWFFFWMPDMLQLHPTWRRAVGVHLKKQSHSNIHTLHQYRENFSSPWVEPATPIINFVKTKQSLTCIGFWRSQTVFHTWDTLLPNWKSKIQEWVFLETNPTSQYDVQSLQGSSLSERFYFLCQSTNLQPVVWLPAASLPPQDAAVYFTMESCSQKLRWLNPRLPSP